MGLIKTGLIGYFEFQVISPTQLSGMFFNIHSDKTGVEATKRDDLLSSIAGDYLSEWEENGKVERSNLKIEASKQYEKIYHLTWTFEGSKETHIGKGILRNGCLNGYYYRSK